QGQTDEATRITEDLVKERGDDFQNLYLKGWLYRETDRFEEAARIYQDLLERVDKDEKLERQEKDETLTRIQYKLSDGYIHLNRIDKAGELLQALLAKDPDDPTYNNDLGYIWANSGMNLDQAEKLIRKALAEDRKKWLKDNPDLKPDDYPANPAYLDSMG